MTDEADRPRSSSPWPQALRAGLSAFGVVGAVGFAASVLVWLLADPAYGLGVALRIGALYLGAFHHVPVRIEGEFDIEELTGGVLPGSELPTEGSSFVEIGIALLSLTVLASWLLFRAGHRVAGTGGGSLGRHLVRGAAVAPSYAVPVLLVALFVTIEEPLGLGRLVEGEIRASLAQLQALVFPLLLAAVSGAAGGLWSWVEARPGEARPQVAGAALAGGWRMLWLGLALSYGGLFVAGVVQPDEPVAALTPSTARYFDAVFERPALGVAVLGHHLALAPNEAAWILVPAAGGCDVARGSVEEEFLCYRRFPRDVGRELGSGAPAPPSSSFGTAPAAYFLFALIPAVATVLGGRHSALRVGASGRPGARIGALGGVVFALLLVATSLLAGISLEYGATLGERGGGGSVWMGPELSSALVAGIAWGALGGGLGGATSGVRSVAAPSGGGSAPR